MRRTRSGFDLPRDSGWMKRRKPGVGTGWEKISRLLLVLAALAVPSAAWEDGDDAVNVISVENLDALLGLRMVTELKSFEGVKTNESENRFVDGGDVDVNTTDPQPSEAARYKRMIHPKWKTFPVSSQVSDLCSTGRCLCAKNFQDERVNVSCDFNNEKIILEPGSIPSSAQQIDMRNAKHLNISPGTFSHHRQLQKVHVHHLGTLLVSDSAFQNLSATVNFNFTIQDCKHLIIEDHAFRNLYNPMSVTVLDCFHVILRKSAFHWFTHVHIQNVPNIELEENTFSSEVVRQDVEWPGASMSFVNVTFHEIPNATFPLSSAKIVFLNCTITVIRSGAFNGIFLFSVFFQSTRLKRIEGEAFSERTLIQNLELDDVDIQCVDSNAFSAVAKFTIQNCRVEEMTSGAFNVSTAYLKVLNSYFLKIRRNAFEIHNWNSIAIEGNHFNDLEPGFFSAPFSNITTVTTEFTFVNNTLAHVDVDVLSFVPDDLGLISLVEGNIFEYVCTCNLKRWIRERAGNSWQSFYETSFCVISDLLEKCYNISRGYMNVEKFAREFCTAENVNVCEDVRKTIRPNILIPLDLHNTERTILGIIFFGVLCSTAIMITILLLLWVKNKSFCADKRKSQTPNSDCFSSGCFRFCHNGNLVSSDSISRMNIHEYAEIQNQLNQQQKQTSLTIEEELDDEEDMVECENKATQTIPEELTQELIQSLREKLDNPENYNEARDMIEHLYDLIKVEESCNNNNPSRPNSFVLEDDEEEGIYEVIHSNKSSTMKSGRTRRRHAGRDVTSTGTRAPSPDKLSPITFNVIRPLTTIVSDYVEPKDRKSNEYCELPSTTANHNMPDVLTSSRIKGDKTLPKTHIYAEPLQTGTLAMGSRPLPSKPADPGPSEI